MDININVHKDMTAGDVHVATTDRPAKKKAKLFSTIGDATSMMKNWDKWDEEHKGQGRVFGGMGEKDPAALRDRAKFHEGRAKQMAQRNPTAARLHGEMASMYRGAAKNEPGSRGSMFMTEEMLRQHDPAYNTKFYDEHKARMDQQSASDARANARANMKKSSFSISVPISKMEEDKRLVFGWASVIEKDGERIIDHQGDAISEAELESAFYDFAKNGRQTGEMHVGNGFGDLVECVVFTKEKQQALGIDLKCVGAWVGFRVPPDVFAKIKSGDYAAFSIQGSGVRTPIEGDQP